jgi:hypothetical protein
LTAEGTISKGTRSISCEFIFCIFYRLSLKTLRTKDVARLIMDCRTLPEAPRPLRMVLEAYKLRWWSVFSFSIGAENTKSFKRATEKKNTRNDVGWTWGLYFEKLSVCRHILIWIVALFWCGKHSA